MDTIYWLNSAGMMSLIDSAEKHKNNYLSGDFSSFFESNNSKLQDIGIKVDSSKLKNLSGQSQNEVQDSCILYQAISGMTPSLAAQGNVWVVLSHTKLLSYGRKRWLEGKENPIREIKKHFLSLTPGTLRDDHVASRLWWNAYLASRIAGTDDISLIKETLKLFFRTTDTRQSSIERPSTFGDVYLARLILEHVKHTPSLSNEDNYRVFAKKVNFETNGIKFTDMNYETFANRFG